MPPPRWPLDRLRGGAAPARKTTPSACVRLVVFDFDQTLSCIHVFKSLAGWSEKGGARVPKPFAMTERGQMRKIEDLNAVEPFRGEGFASLAFGGRARVEQVRQLLTLLREREAEIVICTKGLVGAVKKCLLDLGLAEFFTEVYGNVGDGYGETAYDRRVADYEPDASEARLLGDPETANWGSKEKLISQLMRRMGLMRDEAVLVEDDPEEIRRATNTCRTLFVQEAAGITAEHFGALQRMTDPELAGRQISLGEVCDEGLFACGRGTPLLPALDRSSQQHKARARSMPTVGGQRRSAMPRERR